MTQNQWIGIVLMLLLVWCITLAFVRTGTKIRPDPESKPDSGLEGGGDSAGSH